MSARFSARSPLCAFHISVWNRRLSGVFFFGDVWARLYSFCSNMCVTAGQIFGKSIKRIKGYCYYIFLFKSQELNMPRSPSSRSNNSEPSPKRLVRLRILLFPRPTRTHVIVRIKAHSRILKILLTDLFLEDFRMISVRIRRSYWFKR